MKLPAEPKLEHLPPAICDKREQCPAVIDPWRVVRATLDTGDYSISSLETVVCVERKSEGDFLSCCGTERERFQREIDRMRGFPHKVLVVETTLDRINAGNWRSQITPAQAMGSLIGWAADGIPFFLAGDHEAAGKFISRFLFIAFRRRWREARALAAGIVEIETNAV
jgi:DNA excision repair protein ERCC-4